MIKSFEGKTPKIGNNVFIKSGFKVFTLPDAGLTEAIKKAFQDAIDECKYQSGQ